MTTMPIMTGSADSTHETMNATLDMINIATNPKTAAIVFIAALIA